MVVPLRINHKDADVEYIPMMVSIKSEWTFQQAHAKAACDAMKARAHDSGLTKALCLLICFGSSPRSRSFINEIAITSSASDKKAAPKSDITSPGTDAGGASQQDTITPPGTGRTRSSKRRSMPDVGQSVSELLLKGGLVAKAIRVPHDDVFRLTDAFRNMTPDSQVNSELLSSHSFLMAHGNKSYDDLKAVNALCASSSEMSKEKYNDLRHAMKAQAKHRAGIERVVPRTAR